MQMGRVLPIVKCHRWGKLKSGNSSLGFRLSAPFGRMRHLPGLAPTFCTVLSEDFLRQACVEVRRKTASHQRMKKRRPRRRLGI
jgi:hypothetical protein